MVTSDTIICREFLSAWAENRYLITECDYDSSKAYVWENGDILNLNKRGCWRRIDIVDLINRDIWKLVK